MKQMIALTLALALLGGCGSAPPASSASQQLSGETVSGIITKVNGNEISLELVTLRQGAGALPAGEEETGTEAAAGESFGGGVLPEAGGMPPGAGGDGGGGAAAQSYTRTGETALYRIPVGAEVITLTGTSRDFNSLSPDLLVTITFREDGVTPGQVQVVQSLS